MEYPNFSLFLQSNRILYVGNIIYILYLHDYYEAIYTLYTSITSGAVHGGSVE